MLFFPWKWTNDNEPWSNLKNYLRPLPFILLFKFAPYHLISTYLHLQVVLIIFKTKCLWKCCLLISKTFSYLQNCILFEWCLFAPISIFDFHFRVFYQLFSKHLYENTAFSFSEPFLLSLKFWSSLPHVQVQFYTNQFQHIHYSIHSTFAHPFLLHIGFCLSLCLSREIAPPNWRKRYHFQNVNFTTGQSYFFKDGPLPF